MDIKEAVKGCILDGKISGQSSEYLATKERRLYLFADWLKGQGIMSLEAVTPTAVRGFVVFLQEQKSPSQNPQRPAHDKSLSPLTIKGYMLIIRAFFSWCKQEELLPKGMDDPSRRVPQVKIPEYVIATFTQQQLASMIDSCDVSTAYGFRDYAILLVLIDCGIRASELCRLTLDNVFDDYLKVFGKGQKEREVGIGMTASRALWTYMHRFRPQIVTSQHEEHVFLGWGGKPLTRSGLYQMLIRIGERAGIVGVRISPHTFRHTFARSYLEADGEVFKLSRLLGHSQIQTTEKYLKDFKSREARLEHERFSPVERLKLGKQHRKSKDGKGKKS